MLTGRRTIRDAPVVTRALVIAVPMVVLAIPIVVFSPILALGLLLSGICLLLFYRDPNRNPPKQGIVSPADGRVSVIRREGDRWRIGVFMHVFNVHVNRAPVAGKIGAITHRPGAHRPAFSKDSDHNERVDMHLSAAGGSFEVSLIAGTVARRISPYVSDGDTVDQGERIGHIAFGSRADVLLPPTVSRDALDVSVGDTVTAGETILVSEHISCPKAEGSQ